MPQAAPAGANLLTDPTLGHTSGATLYGDGLANSTPAEWVNADSTSVFSAAIVP